MDGYIPDEAPDRVLGKGECGCPDLDDGWEYWTGDPEVEEVLYRDVVGYRSDRQRMTELLDRSNHIPGTRQYSGGYQFGRLSVGPRRRRSRLTADPELEARIREMWAAGVPIREMAAAVRAKFKTLSSWVRRMGLPKRKRGRKRGWRACLVSSDAGAGVKICRTCCRIYEAVRHDQRYCCKGCYSVANRRAARVRNNREASRQSPYTPLGPVEMRGVCKTCGCSFPAGWRRGEASYCTRDCFHRAYRLSNQPSGWEQRNALDRVLADRVAAGRPVCRVCSRQFEPYYATQVCCGVTCLSRHEAAKIREQVDRVQRERCR